MGQGCANGCAKPAGEDIPEEVMRRNKSMVEEVRSWTPGPGASQHPPVVIASPALEKLAVSIRKVLTPGEPANDEAGVSWEVFKSGDPNTRFNWRNLSGRKVLFLFDTVDQSRLFEQLSVLQALQGFPVPDGEDAPHKWKTYAAEGKYSWGRAAEILVVIPWYRPCQMERTSRWHLADGKWSNTDANGSWLDVPTAQTYVRLVSTQCAPPPGGGPASALDGMPLHPLWRPPMSLLFIELHEEEPVQNAVHGIHVKIRMERFVPYFLRFMKAKPSYAGTEHTFILFPDHGAYERYSGNVIEELGLELDHILYIKKTRSGETIKQEQKLFYEKANGEDGEKSTFVPTDHVIIVDDFTNSGGTLFGAVNLARSLAGGDGDNMAVSIYVSHLVAAYDEKVVDGIKEKLEKCGPKCTFYTTSTIPKTTDMLRGHPQAEILDLSDFIASLVV